jgi:hypothetical protein
MQIRHARRGDEAQPAFLLEDHERPYGNQVADGAGARGAAYLVDAPPGGTICLVAELDGRLVGFAILNPYFPDLNLTHGLFLKELYVTGDARVIWTTGENNSGSQRFYDRLGLRREKKVCYVMDPRAPAP